TGPAARASTAMAQRHVARAREYARRLWCRDAFGEYERAIEIDPTVRSEAQTIEDGAHCLVESQRGRGPAIHFLSDVVGHPAAEGMRALAESTRSPEVKRAAEDVLARLK